VLRAPTDHSYQLGVNRRVPGTERWVARRRWRAGQGGVWKALLDRSTYSPLSAWKMSSVNFACKSGSQKLISFLLLDNPLAEDVQ